MKCERCNRPILTKPAATLRAFRETYNYGPKCAKIMGLANTATRYKAPEKTTEDENQMGLQFDAQK